jgi:hypothetical protein
VLEMTERCLNIGIWLLEKMALGVHPSREPDCGWKSKRVHGWMLFLRPMGCVADDCPILGGLLRQWLEFARTIGFTPFA